MRTLTAFLLILSLSTVCWATEKSAPWSLNELGDGLYTLEIDSTGTKCTIVEFDASLCLIEVSLSKKGGGVKVLTEHREGGEAILQILRERFPDKPLDTVLHSHWHPHSIASVTPFLEEGVSLITTRANFERVQEFVDSSLVEARADLIHFVDEDSFVIGQGSGRIVVYRLQKEEYPSIPSPDYLFAHLPEHRALCCGCMYSMWRGGPVEGREILTTREQDLYRFITTNELDLDGLIRLNREKGEDGQMLPIARLKDVNENGVTTKELTAPYRELSTDNLHAERDSLVLEVISRGIPGRLFNRLVYDAIGQQDLARAKEFALLQVLTDPSNANAWDTLGAVHYFLGEVAVARAYDKQSRAINPEYDRGGEAEWEKELAEHQKKWAGQSE